MGLTLDSIYGTKLHYHSTITTASTLKTENLALLRGVYLAGTEPHAEFHSSGVTSVPWLCFNIHSTTFPFIEWFSCLQI